MARLLTCAADALGVPPGAQWAGLRAVARKHAGTALAVALRDAADDALAAPACACGRDRFSPWCDCEASDGE